MGPILLPWLCPNCNKITNPPDRDACSLCSAPRPATSVLDKEIAAAREREASTGWVSPIGETVQESIERKKLKWPEYREAAEALEAARDLLDLDSAFGWWTYRCLRWNPERVPSAKQAELERARWTAQFELYNGLAPDASLEEFENAEIVRIVEERLPAADANLGTPLDDAARELGFDPDASRRPST